VEVKHMPAGIPIQVRLQREELDALDRRRRTQSNPPTRGSELRKLIRSILLDGASAQGEGEDVPPLARPAREKVNSIGLRRSGTD
jgi:hypothetical protein